MVKIKCVVCGREVEAQKSTKKYCSKECSNAARRIKWANRPKNEKEQKLMPEKICPICNNTFRPKSAAANQRTCCYSCMPDGTQLTRGGFLAKIKESRGGKCIRCGYSTCIKALEFHHLDPRQKDFTISNDRFKIADAVAESKKCILLCSNCHKELHNNLWDIEELKLEEKEEVEPNDINK